LHICTGRETENWGTIIAFQEYNVTVFGTPDTFLYETRNCWSRYGLCSVAAIISRNNYDSVKKNLIISLDEAERTVQRGGEGTVQEVKWCESKSQTKEYSHLLFFDPFLMRAKTFGDIAYFVQPSFVPLK
jgi:hypothetical protein